MISAFYATLFVKFFLRKIRRNFFKGYLLIEIIIFFICVLLFAQVGFLLVEKYNNHKVKLICTEINNFILQAETEDKEIIAHTLSGKKVYINNKTIKIENLSKKEIEIIESMKILYSDNIKIEFDSSTAIITILN